MCRYLACLWNELNPAQQIAVDHFLTNLPFVDLMKDKQASQTDDPPTCCGDASSLINAWMIRTNFQATKEVIDGKFVALHRFNQGHFDRVRQLMAAMAFAYNPNCFCPFGQDFPRTLADHFEMDIRLDLCAPGHSNFDPVIDGHLHSFLISFQHLLDSPHLSIFGKDYNFIEPLSSMDAIVVEIAGSLEQKTGVDYLIGPLLHNEHLFFSTNGYEIPYPSGVRERLSTIIGSECGLLHQLTERDLESSKFIIFTPKQHGAAGTIVMGDFEIGKLSFKVVSVITITEDGCAAYTVGKDGNVAVYIDGKRVKKEFGPAVNSGHFLVIGRVQMIFVRVHQECVDADIEIARSPEMRRKLGLPKMMKPFVARVLSPVNTFDEVTNSAALISSNCLGKFGLMYKGQYLASFMLECTITPNKPDVRVFTLCQLESASREVYSVTLTGPPKGGWASITPTASVSKWTCVDDRDEDVVNLMNTILLYVVLEYCRRILMINIMAKGKHTEECPCPSDFVGFTARGSADHIFGLDFSTCKRGTIQFKINHSKKV